MMSFLFYPWVSETMRAVCLALLAYGCLEIWLNVTRPGWKLFGD